MEFRVPSLHYVSQLINIFTANWDVNLINNIFPRDISLAILSINVPDPPCPDRLCWSDANVCYSVRSGYKALVASRPFKVKASPSSYFIPPLSLWKYLWKSDVTTKVKFFLWACNSEAIPTKRALWARKCNPSPLCPVCDVEVETIEHMLVLCLWHGMCGLIVLLN